MPNKVCFLLFLLISFPVFAADPPDSLSVCRDSWTGRDKLSHFTLSFFLTVSSSVVIHREAKTDHFLLPAAGIAAGAGVAKEIRDSVTPGNHFCFKDLVWDAAGILVAAGLLL